jgi:dipeptidyl aminopeptidase
VHNDTEPRILVEATKVVDDHGDPIHWSAWSLSADMEYVLFQTDFKKQWRHSSHANYYLHRLSDSSTFPVLDPTIPPIITKCIWSPVGHSLAYVSANDLYVIPGNELARGAEAIRITDDGSEVIFNGVPDWVYEEEVVEADFTTWWSPDGNTIAYLRMDEAEVKNYRLQFYNPSDDAFEPHPYTTDLDMK